LELLLILFCHSELVESAVFSAEIPSAERFSGERPAIVTIPAPFLRHPEASLSVRRAARFRFGDTPGVKQCHCAAIPLIRRAFFPRR